MRKLLMTITLTALTLAPARGNALEALQIEHYAPVPCSVACAYWDVPDAVGFEECAEPFPQGSYDVTRLAFTSESGIIHIESASVVDYDTFACTTNQQRIHLLACGRLQKCSSTGDNCAGIAGSDRVAVGCRESLDLTLNALHAANGGLNDEFLLISYNWSDYAPLPITITGPAEIVDDTYEASII